MIKLFEEYEKTEDIKNDIFLKAIDTEDINIIKFFVDKGYDINGDGVLSKVLNQKNTILRYFLKKGMNIEYDEMDKWKYMEPDVQKELIDFGYDFFIYDKLGKFNPALLSDPKYADKVKAVEDMNKYNL